MADLLTFGCRLNAYESAVIANYAADLDAIVVNTCAVTHEAEQQARQAIRRAAREQPGRPIVVTGCAAQIAPDAWATLPGVVRVVGTAEKLDPAMWRTGASSAVGDIRATRAAPAPAVSDHRGHARAFVAVQHGCDHRCTFCVIPQGRGPSRSVPVGGVVEQARAAMASTSFRRCRRRIRLRIRSHPACTERWRCGISRGSSATSRQRSGSMAAGSSEDSRSRRNPGTSASNRRAIWPSDGRPGRSWP